MPTCVTCGHLRDEHANTFLEECEVDGCECELFDPQEDDEEEVP